MNRSSPAILGEIFLRSNRQPCRLELDFDSFWPMAKDVLAVAVQHSPWWTDVALRIDSALLSELGELRNRTPRLRRLRLRYRTHVTDSPFMDCLRQAPALRSLLLEDSTGSNDFHLLELPWAQLTEFHHFPRIVPTDHLRKMPNLISLTLREGGTKLTSQNKIEHKSLRTLEARDSDSTLLRVLRLPSLQELRVNADQIQVIPALIQRSSCSLKNLCIHGVNASHFSSTTMASLFRQTPDLYSLDIGEKVTLVVASQILELIVGIEYLPRLRRLILPGVLIGRSVKGLVEMVLSRRLAMSPVEEIWFAQKNHPWTLDETTVATNKALLDVTGVKIFMDTKAPGNFLLF
ncbi:hypothetical protein C8J56DRAFT_1090074 [Mycena floridula]|nr:hypothetical protein C8J56DRAFT_1090074 [Mycena floridula]